MFANKGAEEGSDLEVIRVFKALTYMLLILGSWIT